MEGLILLILLLTIAYIEDIYYIHKQRKGGKK